MVHTLQELMDSWLKQSHFPLITVTQLADNKLRLQQQPFLLETSAPATGATTSTAAAAALWIVPLRVVCVTNGVRRTTAAVMRTRELEIQLPADVR
jgi:aminopeptidase N